MSAWCLFDERVSVLFHEMLIGFALLWTRIEHDWVGFMLDKAIAAPPKRSLRSPRWFGLNTFLVMKFCVSVEPRIMIVKLIWMIQYIICSVEYDNQNMNIHIYCVAFT